MAYYGQTHNSGNCNCADKNWTVSERLVNDSFIKRDAEKSCVGRMCLCLGPGWYRRQSIFWMYFFAGIGFIVGASVLIGLGLGLVMPYVRSMAYRETTCYVSRTTYATKSLRCGCGRYCSSEYPCLEIFVNYTRYDNTQVTCLLRENEQFGECTYKPSCSNNCDENAKRVLSYKEKYGSGNYSCLYDVTIGSTNVIRTRMLGAAGMLHSLLWPSVFMALSIACILFLICACGCKYVCISHPPRDVKEAAQAQATRGVNNVAMVSHEPVQAYNPVQY